MKYFKTRQGITIIGLLVAATVALAIIFAAQGCSGEATDTNGTTATTRNETGTTATTEDAAVEVEVISESVSPREATEGDTLIFTVLVKGEATSVSLTDQLPPASSGGQFSENFTMDMSLASRDGDISTWTLQATATNPSRHAYFATAMKADGTSIQAAGEAPTYVVTSGNSQPVASQPPGFSSIISISNFTWSVSSVPIHQGDQIDFMAYLVGDAYNVSVYVESLTDPSLNYGVPLSLVGAAGPSNPGTMLWRLDGLVAPVPGDYTVYTYATDPVGGGAQSSFTMPLTVLP